MAATINDFSYSQRTMLILGLPSEIDQLIVRMAFSTLVNSSDAKSGFDSLECVPGIKNILPLLADVETGIKLSADNALLDNRAMIQNIVLQKLNEIFSTNIDGTYSGSNNVPSYETFDFPLKCRILLSSCRQKEYDVVPSRDALLEDRYLTMDSVPKIHVFGPLTPPKSIFHLLRRPWTYHMKDLLALFKYIKEPLDINARDFDSTTLLHKAIKTNNLSLINFLVEEGANVNAISKGQTPFDIAEAEIQKRQLSAVYNNSLVQLNSTNERTEMAEYLRKNGAKRLLELT